MEILEKHARSLDFRVELVVRVAIEDVGAVHHIGRAGDLQRRDRGLGSDGPPRIKSHQHRHPFHDADHILLHVVVGRVPLDFLGQHADIFARIDDVEGAIDDAGLLFGQVEMDGVVGHLQRLFFLALQAELPHPLDIFGRSGVDEDVVRVAHGNGIGDGQQRFLVRDPRQLRLIFRVQPLSEQGLGLIQGVNAADIGQDVDALA